MGGVLRGGHRQCTEWAERGGDGRERVSSYTTETFGTTGRADNEQHGVGTRETEAWEQQRNGSKSPVNYYSWYRSSMLMLLAHRGVKKSLGNEIVSCLLAC